ncbi:hypothetical protein HDU87_002670 [Geranomyces variabilis]|uniref:Uncharacterized protein n=1 Tax=Geranomyces variabilis TaxID=109894 RepID=A0AAD5XUT5_9FUNG|nr:hypothetical protein HDU87_002670 [Geranomyces variabilis]
MDVTASMPGDITCPRSSLTFLCVESADLAQPSFVETLGRRIQACRTRFANVQLLVRIRDTDTITPYFGLQYELLADRDESRDVQIQPVHTKDEVMHTVTWLALLLDAGNRDFVAGIVSEAIDELAGTGVPTEERLPMAY